MNASGEPLKIEIATFGWFFITFIKTYIARVSLSNGSTVTATERTESLNFARQIFQHKFGKNNVFSVYELTETVIDEATKSLTPQQLQVKSLADQEIKLKQQKKQPQARQTDNTTGPRLHGRGCGRVHHLAGR
jgi:hypothetical protein